MNDADEPFEYIIVGAGSAGCVLANRLSADPSNRVLLIEAGPEDTSPWIHFPRGLVKLMADPNHCWHTPASVSDRNTPEVWLRGRMLGGSSSINGMIYVRGQPEDYDEWEQRGAAGWNWAAMKQAFRAIEDHELGDEGVRGAGGPVHISTGKYRYPLSEALVRAGEEMGLDRREDLNREDQEGVGYYLHNIKNGRRQSAAVTFLHPAVKRGNVHVETGVEVDRLVFEGRRVVGVQGRRDGQPVAYRCKGEVILSAGALASPRLLQLSGIGPAAELAALGIEVVCDSPDVGARMREHLGFAIPYRLKRGDRGINHRFYGPGLWMSALRYVLRHDGPLATGPFEVGAFVRTEPQVDRPDAQLYMGAFTFARGDDTFPVPLAEVERAPGLTMYGQLLRLTSEGRVMVRSADPAASPVITPNWLATPEDRHAAIAMVRYMRRYMDRPAIRGHLAEELVPGPECQSDEDILRAFRRLSMCGTHAVATCRMGSDNAAVVDATLAVRGVEGLRVVDCSVMPSLVSGNTNGPAMALGWRAGEIIRREQRMGA